MKKKFYDNDWFIISLSFISLTATVVANYYYHGGNVVW